MSNRYQIILPVTSAGKLFEPGQEVHADEFGEGVDFKRLVDQKVIHPLDGPAPDVDDNDAAGWKRRATIAEAKLNEAPDTSEKDKQIADLQSQLADAKAKIDAVLPASQRAYESASQEQLVVIAQHKGIAIPDGANKAAIIELLKADDAAKGESNDATTHQSGASA